MNRIHFLPLAHPFLLIKMPFITECHRADDTLSFDMENEKSQSSVIHPNKSSNEELFRIETSNGEKHRESDYSFFLKILRYFVAYYRVRLFKNAHQTLILFYLRHCFTWGIIIMISECWFKVDWTTLPFLSMPSVFHSSVGPYCTSNRCPVYRTTSPKELSPSFDPLSMSTSLITR